MKIITAIIISLSYCWMVSSFDLNPAVIVSKVGEQIVTQEVFFGLVPCKNDSSVVDRFTMLEQELNNLTRMVSNISTINPILAANSRLIDYLDIKELGPVMWLSAYYYNGLRLKSDPSPIGEMMFKNLDIMGNNITQVGELRVLNDLGRSAYYFNKTNSVRSSVSVSTQFTFIVVFKRQEPGDILQGRFFTSATGNRLFASNSNKQGSFRIDYWISKDQQDPLATNNIEMYIATNNNGVKDMWHFDEQIVRGSTVALNDWGTTIIGKPDKYSGQATSIYVYEALVFNRVLSSLERKSITSIFRKYLNI